MDHLIAFERDRPWYSLAILGHAAGAVDALKTLVQRASCRVVSSRCCCLKPAAVQVQYAHG